VKLLGSLKNHTLPLLSGFTLTISLALILLLIKTNNDKSKAISALNIKISEQEQMIENRRQEITEIEAKNEDLEKFVLKDNEIYRISCTEEEYMGEVTETIPSPDKTKTALMAQGYISSPYLFVKDHNNHLETLHAAAQVVWSNNSRYIAYTAKIADAGSTYALYLHDTQKGETIDLRSKDSLLEKIPDGEGRTAFYDPRWSADDSLLIVDYTTYDSIPYGNATGEGVVSIPQSSFY
jgi:hypothetical protein